MARVQAGPAARRRAAELGLSIEVLAAKHGGRVTTAQVEVEASAGRPSDRLADAAAALDARPRRDASVFLGGFFAGAPAVGDARGHARRHTLRQSIDVTRLEAGRQRYCDEQGGRSLSLLAFVLKACTIALREHPRMNASVLRGGRALAIQRDVRVQVLGADTSEVAPTSSPTFWVIPLAHVRLVALDGDPRPSGLSLPPAHVACLGMGRPRRQGGRVVVGAALAWDARANPEDAARAFLATIVELLADPITMLVRA